MKYFQLLLHLDVVPIVAKKRDPGILDPELFLAEIRKIGKIRKKIWSLGKFVWKIGKKIRFLGKFPPYIRKIGGET